MARVAISGVGGRSGFEYMITATAPGEREHRLPSGDVCACTPPGGVDLARWNASHSRRWNHVRTVLRRQHPGLQFFRGIEVQDRGALHDHALVWSPTPIRKPALRALLMAAGFGHSVDLAPITSPKHASYYVSKYVTKSTDQRAEVPWWGESVDVDTGEVSEGVVDGRYRTWSMSREWGLTMRAVRAEGLAFVQAREAELRAAGEALVLAAFPGAVIVPPAAESPPLSSA